MHPRWVSALTVLLICTAALAVSDPKRDPAKLDEDSPPAPVISEPGFKRIQEAILSTDQNLARGSENNRIIEKNIKTLENEAKELTKLEDENRNLKKKIERYLTYAGAELKKNTRGLKELEDWEKTARAAPSSDTAALTAKLNAVQQEKNKRKLWEQDAKGKIDRVTALGGAIDQNVEAIQKKRPDVLAQIDYWKAEKARHDDLLKSLEKHRKEMEEVAKQTK